MNPLRRSRLAGPLTAILIVFVLAEGFVFWIASGGEQSDEQAVRAWFASDAGGRAPGDILSAIHVDKCLFTDVMSGSHAVMKCEVTTDAPNPLLHTCFVFANGKALSGGWQLAKLDACNSLRFDPNQRTLIDVASGSRYRVAEATGTQHSGTTLTISAP
jgi:hypothetical protein